MRIDRVSAKILVTNLALVVIIACSAGTVLADPKPEEDPEVLRSIRSTAPDVVAAASRRLASSGTDAAMRILINRYLEVLEPDLRWEIASAVRGVRNPDGAEALYDLLLSKDAPALREAAVEALAAVAPRGVIGRCLDLMSRWPDGPVAEAARRVVLTLRNAAAVPELEAALRTETDGVRSAILVESLGRIGTSEAITVLADVYATSPAEMQARAVRAAAIVKNPEGLPALEALLAGNTETLRVAAAQALGNFTDDDARSRIVRYLDNERTLSVRAVLEEALRTVDTRSGRKG